MNKVAVIDNFSEFCAEGVVVVDFWAPWCAPCRALSPLLEELVQELTNVKFGKVNVDEYGQLASSFDIVSIPNICIFNNGVMVDRLVGVQPKEVYVNTINKHIN